MKKFILILLVLSLCNPSYAIRISGGNVSAKTGTDDSGQFIYSTNADNVTPLHGYQVITVCGDNRYLDFMHEDNNSDGETETGIMHWSFPNNQMLFQYYRADIGGTNADADNHNYSWTTCNNSTGHLFRFGSAHVAQLAFFQTHSPGTDYGVHSWTSMTAPTNSDKGTYPRGCLESDGDWHTFWRQGDGAANSQPYIETAKWNGSTWTEKRLVEWDASSDINLAETARIYFEMYCHGDDAYFQFAVRDGNNTTTTPTSFWYIVFFKYEMDTGNAYKGDGTQYTLPVDEADADFIETGNMRNIGQVNYDSTKGVTLVYTIDSEGTGNWFGNDQNIWSAYYDGGWQKNQVTNNDNSEEHRYFKLFGEDTHYILHRDGGVNSVSKSTDFVNWTTTQPYLPCIGRTEQNPDPSKPILCFERFGQDIKMFQINLP